MLHFWAAILLSVHGFAVNWIRRQMAPVGGGGGAGQYIGNNIFQTGQIQHLHIKFRDESQMALLSPRNGDGNARQGGLNRYVDVFQRKNSEMKEFLYVSQWQARWNTSWMYPSGRWDERIPGFVQVADQWDERIPRYVPAEE
jgi:hypothetical protein